MKAFSLTNFIIPAKLREDKELSYVLGQLVNVGGSSTLVIALLGVLWHHIGADVIYKMSVVWVLINLGCFTLLRFGFHRISRLMYLTTTYTL